MKKKKIYYALALLLVIFMSAQCLVEKFNLYFGEQGINFDKTDSAEEIHIQTIQKKEGTTENEKYP